MYVDHFGSRALGYLYPISSFFPHPAHPGKRGRASHRPTTKQDNQQYSRLSKHLSRPSSPHLGCTGRGRNRRAQFLGASSAPRIVANLWRCSAHAEASKKHLPSGGVLRDFLAREVQDGYLCRSGPVNNGEVQRLRGDVPTTSYRPRGPFHPVPTCGGQGGWGTRS
jgi:hypothetical protein